MAASQRLGRRPAARDAAPETSLSEIGKLYRRDVFAFHGEPPGDDGDNRYAGFRAWHDGYKAGLAAKKR